MRKIFVFHRWEDCPPKVTSERALVEVPGEWVHSVVSLAKASQEFRHSGLMVTNVGPKSPAARAGIKCGDVLLRADGHELDSVATLRRLTDTQIYPPQKPLRIAAARGVDDLSFEVSRSELGLTVTPLLYRWGRRKSRWQRILRDLFSSGEKTLRVMPRVVHTLDEARGHDPKSPALAVVPGDLARRLLGVVNSLTRAVSAKQRKRARSLLLAARELA